MSSLSVELKPQFRTMFPPNGGFYEVAVGCDVSVIDQANIAPAIEKLEAAMTPANSDECEDWLMMLQAACARRNDSEDGATVALDLYTAAIRQYPADVAKAACMGMATRRGVNWFPTLGELLEQCDKLAGPRKAMIAALKSPRLAPPQPVNRKPETEAERRAFVAATLAGMLKKPGMAA
jgi:hypothetical protein